MHELAVGLAACGRNGLGHFEMIRAVGLNLPLARSGGRRAQRVERALERAHGDGPQAVALLNRLALLGEAQNAVQGLDRSRPHQRVHSPTAASDASAARMKDHEALAIGGQRARQRALRLMSREA